MAKTNRYRNGVTDLYYSKITQTVGEGITSITYGKPEIVAGTQSINVSYEKGSNEVYESNLKIRDNQRVSGANIEYQTRSMSLDTEEMLVYGLESAEDGSFMEGPDDAGAPCAIGYGNTFTDGSYEAIWFLYATGSANDESSETAGENENTPARSYTFAAMPSPATGKMRRRKICANKAEFDAFMASVLPTGA